MLSLSESIRVTRSYNHNLGWRLGDPEPVGQCHYCRRKPGVTDDHIVPKTIGGSNLKSNIIPACEKCNGDKGDWWPTCQCKRCTIARREFLAQRIEASTATLRERFPQNSIHPPTHPSTEGETDHA